MSRDERLSEAYRGARVVEFDDSARYVFMCDCHRGDGSLADEFTRNENTFLHALERYYHSGFTYVELGDGDELWEFRRLRTIHRAHPRVVEAMKRLFDEGRLIRVWGNHDNDLRSQRYVQEYLFTEPDRLAGGERDLFRGIEPCEAVVFRHARTGQELLALHGHQGDFFNDGAWPVAMLSMRYLWRHLHAFGARSPMSPAKNRHQREEIERGYNTWARKHGIGLICGHTHVYAFPRDDEPPYFNAGCCVYPTSITALELADGQMQLVRWGVTANPEGVLQVAKTILRGPKPVSVFHVA